MTPTHPSIVEDASRLRALDDFNVLDSAPEPGFDDVVAIARELCGTSVALVSLVAADRQWFKARSGFEPCQTPIEQSVCAHALAEPGVLVIPDLTADERTRANSLVTGEPFLRFYAGAPLIAPGGAVLGTVCVIDGAPRPGGLTAAQAGGLQALARQVILLLELRRAVDLRSHALARQTALVRLGDALRDLRDIRSIAYAAVEIMALALGAERAGFGSVDHLRESVSIEPDWRAPGMPSISGVHHFRTYGSFVDDLKRGELVIIDDVATDPRTRDEAAALRAMRILVLVNVPVIERGLLVAVVFLHYDRPKHWSDEERDFLRTAADRTAAAVARIRAEEQQTLLNQELSHRLKNTLAMVQAIASQTLRRVPDREAVEAFKQRIAALGAAHDVLLEQSWAAAPIGMVIRQTLALQADPGRIAFAGPDFAIGSKAVLSLTLLLHELATNAVKYGSLSVEGGVVLLDWILEGHVDPPQFVLTWRERGGPAPVATPPRRGFGSRLIETGLAGTGRANMRYEHEGLHATFRADLALITSS